VNRPLLIGLYSARPQCGKSTVAALLADTGFQVVPFAGTVKAMLRLLLLDLGLSHSEVTLALTTEKEVPLPVLNGVTPRQAMQTLGTEWGRSIDNRLWVKVWRQKVNRLLEQGLSCVIDDIRFLEEARAVVQLGGVMVEVVRPEGGSDAFTEHSSEGGLNDWPFATTIRNTGDLHTLEARVAELLEFCSNQHPEVDG
jgi:hypothetical protein